MARTVGRNGRLLTRDGRKLVCCCDDDDDGDVEFQDLEFRFIYRYFTADCNNALEEVEEVTDGQSAIPGNVTAEFEEIISTQKASYVVNIDPDFVTEGGCFIDTVQGEITKSSSGSVRVGGELRSKEFGIRLFRRPAGTAGGVPPEVENFRFGDEEAIANEVGIVFLAGVTQANVISTTATGTDGTLYDVFVAFARTKIKQSLENTSRDVTVGVPDVPQTPAGTPEQPFQIPPLEAPEILPSDINPESPENDTSSSLFGDDVDLEAPLDGPKRLVVEIEFDGLIRGDNPADCNDAPNNTSMSMPPEDNRCRICDESVPAGECSFIAGAYTNRPNDIFRDITFSRGRLSGERLRNSFVQNTLEEYICGFAGGPPFCCPERADGNGLALDCPSITSCSNTDTDGELGICDGDPPANPSRAICQQNTCFEGFKTRQEASTEANITSEQQSIELMGSL